MSAEKFMYRFIAAIRSQSTMEFKEQLRSVDVLMVDDLQFLIGKDNTQEEFFHTFNALVDAGKQIVVSADKSPSDLSGLEDRLRTRLGCGMVADLHATTFELRISILEAKAARAEAEVPPKVLEFLAHKITSNVRELEGSLNRLIAHANLFGRPITLEGTQEVLHDILKAHDRRVTIEEIQKRVAEHWNIRLADMSSARRARAVARPRQVAMYLAKAAHQPLAAGDRPQVRQPRPHDGHACGEPRHRIDRAGRGFRRAGRAATADAGKLKRRCFLACHFRYTGLPAATPNSAPIRNGPMKFKAERATLLKALAHIQSVAEKRNTIPILANALIVAKAGTLSFTATDMEIAIVEEIAADVSRDGATTAPGRDAV